MTTLGLIGLGPMGKNYLKVIAEIPNSQIKYICSKSKKSLKTFPKDKIKTTDYKNFLNFPLDGVIIATPSITHNEIASFFIERKIPVLIEKPLTLNYQNAKDLAQLQKKKGTKVLVGHTLLYNPAFRDFKKNTKKIGKIISIEFVGANDKPRKDDSVLFDWGSHGVSIILDLLDQEPTGYKVNSYSKNKKQINTISAELNFKGNIKAYLNLNWKSRNKIRKIIVRGSKGEAIFDDLSDKKISLSQINSSNITFPKYLDGQPLVLELQEFINAIKKGHKIYSDINYGLRVVKILSKIEKLIKG